MKKMAILIILIAMTIVLVACDGGADTPAPPDVQPAAEDEVVEPADEPQSPEEPEVEEPETEAVEPTEEEVAQEEAAGEEQPATAGEAASVQPPMDDPNLMPIEQFQMYVDELPVEGWGKTIAAGATLDPAVGPSNNGFPPFVFVDFSSPGDAVMPDPTAVFTFDVPQGRIFAVAPYLAMYQEGGSAYAQEAVSGLQQILDERPQSLDDVLPTLPGFGDAQQGVRGTPTYIDFDGGSGVGFVAGYGQEIGPLLNDTLVYQFVGLTDTHNDTPFGTQYISYVFPLQANFLSDLESVTDEEIGEAEADLAAYLAEKTEQINNAADTDFKPNLSAINTALQLITVNAGEEASEEASVDAGAEETADEEEFPVIGISDKEAGTITPIECPRKLPGDEVEGETYSCGTYTVPLNYEDPESNTIDTTYMVANSRSDSPEADPLIYLVGGPGQSGALLAVYQKDIFEQVRDQRDILFVSMRGTKASQRLGLEDCWGTALQQGRTEQEIVAMSYTPPQESEDATDVSNETRKSAEETLREQQELAQNANSFCQEIFETAGFDVTQFTTANAARDIVDLKNALGYEEYNLAGVSYGTGLALVTMRDHPNSGLRGVILDSPFPPNFTLLKADIRAKHDPTRQLFADCAADAACSAAYPDLWERFKSLLNALDDEPLPDEGSTITSRDVVKQISILAEERAAYMPLMIAELEQGVFDTYHGLRDLKLGSDQPEEGHSPEVQTFFTHVFSAYTDQGADIGVAFAFITEMGEATAQDDARDVMRQMIQEKIEGDAQQQLLNELAGLDDDQLASVAASDEGPESAEGAGESAGFAPLLQQIIACQEKLPFEPLDEALKEYDRLEIPQLAGDRDKMIGRVANCSGWELNVADAVESEAVTSDIPTLILQGEFDNRTPMIWGDTTLETLENGTLAIVPNNGHETWVAADDCVGNIAAAFINDPAQTPDLSCLEEGKVQFVLPDGE